MIPRSELYTAADLRPAHQQDCCSRCQDDDPTRCAKAKAGIPAERPWGQEWPEDEIEGCGCGCHGEESRE